jgi:hypothetical protein
MPYETPKIEICLYMPRDYLLEHQVQVFMAYIIGGSTPSASYVYRDNQNKIMLFLDGILKLAKFKEITFVEKLCESISHEFLHAFVRSEYGDNGFPKEEELAKEFSEIKKSPPPFSEGHKIICNKCGRETWWETCPVCSEELINDEEMKDA